MNIVTLTSIIGAVLGIATLIFGGVKLKSYLAELVKKGASDAASEAVNNWQQVAESQKARMAEMKTSIEDLTQKVETLSQEKIELTQKVDKLQKTIESMIGVDGVGQMVEGAIAHFDSRMTEQMSKMDTIIALVQGKKEPNVVNVTTK